jgi:hypothetical protein
MNRQEQEQESKPLTLPNGYPHDHHHTHLQRRGTPFATNEMIQQEIGRIVSVFVYLVMSIVAIFQHLDHVPPPPPHSEQEQQQHEPTRVTDDLTSQIPISKSQKPACKSMTSLFRLLKLMTIAIWPGIQADIIKNLNAMFWMSVGLIMIQVPLLFIGQLFSGYIIPNISLIIFTNFISLILGTIYHHITL